MANHPGRPQPGIPQKDKPLTADQLNRIVDMLIRRIEGGKGINIRTFGGRIIIEDSEL
jgi:hypothetical protein